MTGNNQPGSAYLRNKIMNASPMQLIIILYEGAICALHKSKELRAGRKPEPACGEIVRAQDMVRELRNALDMSQGSFAAGLYRLYNYMIHQLINANLEADDTKVDEVISMLTELKDTWLQAMKQAGTEPASSANSEVPDAGYLSIIG